MAAPYASTPARSDSEIEQIARRVLDRDPRIQGAQYAPQARVYNNAAIAITTATVTTLTLNSEDYDLGTVTEQHSTAAVTSRLTCRVPGLYQTSAHLEYAANAVGYRALGIFYNGAATLALQRVPAVADGTVTALSVSTGYRLAVGDYIEMVTLQSSGGNLNVQASANYSPYLAWHWTGP